MLRNKYSSQYKRRAADISIIEKKSIIAFSELNSGSFNSAVYVRPDETQGIAKYQSSHNSTLLPNGYAVNLRFDHDTLAGERGIDILSGLLKGFFGSGGMEMQLNVLDPAMLEYARLHPGKYPELVVRVSGYCAYFDDLPDAVKKR